MNQYTSDSGYKVAKGVCHFPINRTFTIDQNKAQSIEYLEFDAPYDWFSSRSINKCIGLRECKVVPVSGDVIMHVAVKYNKEIIDDDVVKIDEEIVHIDFNIAINSTTSTREIAQSITNAFNTEQTSIENRLMMMYYYEDNTLEFYVAYKKLSDDKYTLDDVYIYLYDDCPNDIIKFFNQPETMIPKINSWQDHLEFNNCWDRQTIYIHSSLSSDYNQLFCENNCKYDPRAWLYPAEQATFKIWFSLDMKNTITLYNSFTLILKLSFILNYRNAAV